MKKILILGAGVYQVPLIQKAREMGLYTIVASIPGNYPGFQYADRVVYENTVDAQAILKLAKEEQIDGICTTGTDVAMITVGTVCDALGLSGVSLEGAIAATDKAVAKEKYRAFGVNTAAFRYVPIEESLQAVEAICEEIGYPVIVKAVDSSGSRGITRVNDASCIEQAVENAKAVTRQTHYLVEKFLIGEEFGAQAFVQNGKVEFILPHGDYVFQGDTGVPIGHFAPYDVHGLDAQVREQTELAIRAMGLDNCAINADFILCDGKPYVLEIGARGGATCLVELVSIFYGFDYYEKMLRVALGETVSFEPKITPGVPNVGMLLRSDKTGTIVRQENHNAPSDQLVEVQFDYQVGDTVRKFHIGPDRIGHVVTKGSTLEEAHAAMEAALQNITLQVEETE